MIKLIDILNELGPNDIHRMNILNYFDQSDKVTQSIILNLVYGSKNRAELDSNLSEMTYEETVEIEKELNIENLYENKKPCWKGYKQIGMKTKNGKEVPNCVPIKRK